MPSFPHEGYVHLFRERPALAPDLLARVLGVDLPKYAEVETTEAEFPQLIPTTFRADLVLLLKSGVPRFGIVVEVQISRAERKRYTWPVYATAVRARHEVPVVVLVYCPTRSLARWARQPIEIGPGRYWAPHVIGPESTPRIESVAEARATPELAILSAVAYGDDTDGLATLDAAMHAIETLSDELRVIYFDLLLASVGEAARKALLKMAQAGNYEFASDFAKKYVAQGRAQGEAVGRAQGEAVGRAQGEAVGRAAGRAEALIQVLQLRGLAVDEALRTRIHRASIETLEAWLNNAVTARAITDVFADD